jgi:hypothetical protein
MQKPHIIENEDGSIVIEWIKKEKRFGICIENDLRQSSWYFASKENPELEMACNQDEIVEYMKKYFE